MRASNFYAGGRFDRVANLRKDAEWVSRQLADQATRFVPVWRQRHLVHETPDGLRPLFVDRLQLENLAVTVDEATLLGLDRGISHFTVALPDGLAAEAHDWAGGAGTKFNELRALGPLLPGEDAALLAFARGLLYWHSRNRFCGACGWAARSDEAGHVRRCTNPDCGISHFPRTDPAVIMLVTDGDRCLLGRQASWPSAMYSALAGFVEPGESLEEAVAREVFEEAGIRVSSVDYHSSQPWPFPASIMLGFYATAETTDIKVDPGELQDARWVERGWLAEHRQSDAFHVPPPFAIARRLIDDWIAEG